MTDCELRGELKKKDTERSSGPIKQGHGKELAFYLKDKRKTLSVLSDKL